MQWRDAVWWENAGRGFPHTRAQSTHRISGATPSQLSENEGALTAKVKMGGWANVQTMANVSVLQIPNRIIARTHTPHMPTCEELRTCPPKTCIKAFIAFKFICCETKGAEGETGVKRQTRLYTCSSASCEPCDSSCLILSRDSTSPSDTLVERVRVCVWVV